MFDLLCIGNAIVDVFAPADPAWLDGLGITAPVQHIPEELARRLLGELSGRADAVLCSGGAAANVAKIAAMLGVGAAFAGCVGADQDGGLAAVFRDQLEAAGVVPFLKTGAEMTGLCFVFSCDGTRIAAFPGASLEFAKADADEEMIAAAGSLVLDGFMLDRRPLVEHILRLAGQRKIPIALDAASVFQIREQADAILRYCRSYPLTVFMNADECIAFYSIITKGDADDAVWGGDDKEHFILREVCPALKRLTGEGEYPVIVIKLGGRGAAVLAGGDVLYEETSAIVPRDAVGAGDAFCAAFLSARIRGKPYRECAALGNKVAREILSVPGTQIESAQLRPFAFI